MLKDDLYSDLRTAMKEKKEVEVRTLRMIIASVKNREVEKKDLDDDDIIEILLKEAKKRNESIEEFLKGKRDDLVNEERADLEVIKRYLPEKMTDDELRKIVLETIEELKINSPSGLGFVMKTVMPKLKGRADGKTVNVMVRDLLSNL
ncbi:MAG TPA: GatB/YqeY domain-containing protein [Thermotogota bacterium]|nr:GatB/YqeY domain-containing protein [Thermotogota bacterium]HPJ87628.1 GatB/YqeY domain-containing protein [Thermotogota bacterium]HPR94934.1 GatB/YqeY domain-containing protein [Thermotogota bacterium]